MAPTVSIIIPTYNRSDLLGQTLDSIRHQTFSDWECVVVDDRSSDWTDELMEFYCNTEERIKYVKRPKGSPKGANFCRNLGLELSLGEFIQFFDSDDLMLPNALYLKTNGIREKGSDFVVAKLINFRPGGSMEEQYYNRPSTGIVLRSYLFREINWMTPDPLLRKSVLEKNVIRFNEKMHSDQEYNFYCKFLAYTEKGVYLEEVLTKRRIHRSSVQSGLNRDSRKYRLELFKNRFLTFIDLERIIEKGLRQEYLNQIMTIFYLNLNKGIFFPYHLGFFLKIIRYKGLVKFLFFTGALASNIILGKGYKLLQFSKGNEI